MVVNRLSNYASWFWSSSPVHNWDTKSAHNASCASAGYHRHLGRPQSRIHTHSRHSLPKLCTPTASAYSWCTAWLRFDQWKVPSSHHGIYGTPQDRHQIWMQSEVHLRLGAYSIVCQCHCCREYCYPRSRDTALFAQSDWETFHRKKKSHRTPRSDDQYILTLGERM